VLSYLTDPFFEKSGAPGPRGHTNWQECRVIAERWCEAGHSVEVVASTDQNYVPPDDAFALIDIHSNLERWWDHPAPVKILHATGTHWLTQNRAEFERLEALRNRRGASLIPRRIAVPSRGAECATSITYLGNDFTAGSFLFAHKPMCRIPLSSAHEFSFPGDKDWDSARRRFLWLGSYGMVHKGLDLVLDVIAGRPDWHLTVCGRPEKEEDFFALYREILTKRPNVHYAGWTDLASPAFENIRRSHGSIVYPSCSEGGGGSVIHCMHAGLLPVVTDEASVDIRDFGQRIEGGRPDHVVHAMEAVASTPPPEFAKRVRAAWEHVRIHHTRERFAAAYRDFVASLLQ
jgi:hypothetical protein